MKQASIRIRAAGFLAVFWFVCGQPAFGECGFAGVYAPESRAAHADPSSQHEILGAHRSLPAGTRVVVRNQQKGRSIIVRILNSGLSGLGQIIDLSAGAMHALGMEAPAPVCFEVLTYGSESHGYQKLTMRNLNANGQVRRRYTKTGSRVRLAREGRHRHKAGARHGSSKRYAKLRRRNQTVKRSSRRRRSARG